jgi:hypothetical protein
MNLKKWRKDMVARLYAKGALAKNSLRRRKMRRNQWRRRNQ